MCANTLMARRYHVQMLSKLDLLGLLWDDGIPAMVHNRFFWPFSQSITGCFGETRLCLTCTYLVMSWKALILILMLILLLFSLLLLLLLLLAEAPHTCSGSEHILGSWIKARACDRATSESAVLRVPGWVMQGMPLDLPC